MSSHVYTLLQEAERLDNRTLDDFIGHVLSLRARRSHSGKEEAALLEKINKGLPLAQAQRLRVLNQKRQTTSLTQQEQAELLTLVEKSERLTVSRLKRLTALARLRNVSVRELMVQLGVGTTGGNHS